MALGEAESIEATVAARRERLRALKSAQELLGTPDDDDSSPAIAEPQHSNNQFHTDHGEQKQQIEQEEEKEEDNVNLKFRNYLPHDKQLQDGKLAPPTLPKFEDPVLAAPPEEKKEDPFLNIAPKKPNWDLRRDVQKRLDKLERRTQKSMLTLMAEEAKKRGENGSNGEIADNGGED